MISSFRTGANTEYMDILDKELPLTDLQGNEITYSSNFNINMRPSDDYTEDYIAGVRQEFRIMYFQYKRKYSRWSALFKNINKLIEQPVVYQPDYLLKDLENPDTLPVLEEMALKPRPNDKK